ncbi:uncharacterized protein NECHADRAFT_35712 [Fusarium vanettenii 77-13-4]|uniref:Ribosomal RNA-processing protein 40 n=1 Tax=Fusarium vanettenii (strain ATCC MYA-4622 / CBS 123669 / FGSC 9596 / NRRL 45880 / 77-13-4) TaxID=660122 RepID=C7YMQ8_FUSV7|nr:uncharacterized protein NECHADRAFT_35712 [Fusarium vanettenii 77-13-4]EEU47488.1 predicted protein [Fusarium vanettenii 77-13-4]
MASEAVFVLPGDNIDPSHIPSHPKKPLRLGPGLRHVPPNDIVPTIAGQLVTDRQKNAIRVENARGRYTPRVGELVIGTVQRSAAEIFYVTLSDYTAPALLPQLSFEGATKKTRPQLVPGALVYARADGLGPLTGGMLFNVSLGMARRLMMPKSVQEGRIAVLEELGAAGLQFETATGRNGKFWVDSESTKTVIAVGRAVQETDEKRLDVEDQKKLVRKIIKELS